MNFKDAYKNMTDEIHGDKALLHAILNGETEKKKRFDFRFKPIYAPVLAVVFALCITTIYLNTGIEDYSPSSNSFETPVTDSYKVESGDVLPADADGTKAEDAVTDAEIRTEDTLPSAQENRLATEKNDAASKAVGFDEKKVRVKSQPESVIPHIAETSPAEVRDVSPDKDESSTNVQISAASKKEVSESASLDVAVPAESNSAVMPLSEMSDQPASLPETAPDVTESTPSQAYGYAPSYDPSDFVTQKETVNSNYAGVDGSDKPGRYSSGGGASSSKSADVTSKAVIPGDMSFSKIMNTGNGTVEYTAVSEDNPERKIVIAVGSEADVQSDYPTAQYVKTNTGTVAVVTDNLTNAEINNLVSSLEN